MNSLLPVIEDHTFTDQDLVGGDAVLDFINTMTGRNGRPRDWIASYAGLADWAALVDLLPKRLCGRLKESALRSPSEAASALSSARDLRELLFGVLTQLITDRRAPAADLALLHTYWCRSIEKHTLQPVEGSIRLILPTASAALDSITDLLAIRAVDLVRNLPASRFRMCSGPNCAWLFIDSSKAGRRRWCDMATCGNASKTRRFYLAKRKSAKTRGS
jgi:predicted RNA-binding Zn ribbon-like protein